MGVNTIKERTSGEVQLVTFVVGQESFGLDIMNVQEVIRMPAITRVPHAPDYVDGMTNLRSHILPVIDTRTKFGMEKEAIGESNRVIVVDTGRMVAGLNVDSVSEVLRVDGRNIEEAPVSLTENVNSSSIIGVVKLDDGKKLVMVLDAVSLLDQTENGDRSFKNIKNEQEESEASLDEVQIVSFQVGQEEFGIEIAEVKEIIRIPDIVKVPTVPEYIKGIISLRDILIPIVDMRIKLGMNNDERTATTRIVVVETAGNMVGLIVDQVFEVIRIPQDTIFPPPEAILNEPGEEVTGIARLDDGKRIIMLMDVRGIISQSMINKELVEEIDSGEAENEQEQEKDPERGTDERQLVVFKLDNEEFGVNIDQVQEITKLSQITKVPRVPKFVQGVINLRGEVVPVIDLRKRFEIAINENTDRTRIIVSETNNRKVGLIIDEVLEVLRISERQFEAVPEIVNDGQSKGYMDGVVNMENRMIMALNLDNILMAQEWKQLKKMDETMKKKASAKLKKQKE